MECQQFIGLVELVEKEEELTYPHVILEQELVTIWLVEVEIEQIHMVDYIPPPE